MLAQGGRLEVESPDYILVVETPPTVDPQPVFVPIATSAVLDVNGKYVPLDSFYVSSWTGSANTAYGRRYGWLDHYVNPRPEIPMQRVFRETNVPFPAMGYTLGGVWALPDCFEVVPGDTQRLRYIPEKDPSGHWYQKVAATGVSIVT